MKVLSLYLGHQQRGCWQRLYRLLIHLANNNHDITLICNDRSCVVLHPNIKVKNLHFRWLSQPINDFLFLLFSPILVLFTTIMKPVETLIAFDGHNAALLSFAKIIKKNTSLALFVRGHPIYHNWLNNSFDTLNYILRHLDKIGHYYADKIIYNSYMTAFSLEAVYGFEDRNFDVLYNDAKSSPRINLNSNRSYREELKISDDFVIGYCGQLIKRKNIHFIIDALSNLKQHRIYLIIKGKGPLEDSLKMKVKNYALDEKVFFLPWDNDMEKFYNTIDIFILPSIYDDCSNALLEALSYQKCVLASQTGGNLELLNGKKELLFDISKGSDPLLKILTKLIEDKSLLERYQNECVNISRKFNLNWEAKAEHILLSLSTNKIKTSNNSFHF